PGEPDVHAPQGVGDGSEAVEVDLDVVVDGQAREVVDRLHYGRDALVVEAVDLLEPPAGRGYPQVPREGEGHRLGGCGVDMEQDDAVGALAAVAVGVGGVVVLQVLGIEHGPGVRAENQHVHWRLGLLRGARGTHRSVAVDQRTGVEEKRHAGDDHDEGDQGQGPQDAPDNPAPPGGPQAVTPRLTTGAPRPASGPGRADRRLL